MYGFDISGTDLDLTPASFEVGGIESNGSLANEYSATVKRSKMAYRCTGSKGAIVLINESVSSVTVYFYSANGSFISSSNVQYSSQVMTFDYPVNAFCYKVCITTSVDLDVAGYCSGDECFNPNVISQSIGSSIAFVYKVSYNAYTSGRLILPPNYSMYGESVPLIVFVHGSGGMTTWDSVIGYAGDDADYRPYLNYLGDEGFAVFDCYPWTNKENITTPVYSPYEVAVNIASYISGIKYVCSRFNVNIDKVNLLCKSQGGHLGHWACVQNIIPLRSVSLFAPSYGIGITTLMFNAALRGAVVAYSDFDGTSAEKETFIQNGTYSNSTVKSFCDSNKSKLVSLMPFAHGVVNSSLDELYALNFQTLSSVPQWELDEGLPTKPSGAVTIGAMAGINDFIKTSYYPVKFWGACDDNATSTYNNYAICRWLQNGGSDAEFRILPNNTGGHHAMDSAASALKKSGTTALGISYTNMPLAYTEVVDFIRLKCGD